LVFALEMVLFILTYVGRVVEQWIVDTFVFAVILTIVI